MLAASFPAWAALGQYEGSVSSDQTRLRSEDNVQTFAAYKVHQLTTTNGVTVREFVSPKGMVFGVAWQASFMPDMNQLLGNYATNLQTAPQAQTRIIHHRGLIVKTNDFVYSNFGVMRLWKGYAYVPSLVPNNVSVEVVK
jgi:hypothetical protein